MHEDSLILAPGFARFFCCINFVQHSIYLLFGWSVRVHDEIYVIQPESCGNLFFIYLHLGRCAQVDERSHSHRFQLMKTFFGWLSTSIQIRVHFVKIRQVRLDLGFFRLRRFGGVLAPGSV